MYPFFSEKEVTMATQAQICTLRLIRKRGLAFWGRKKAWCGEAAADDLAQWPAQAAGRLRKVLSAV